MKKEYINPETTTFELNQELMITNVSTGNGNPHITVDDDDNTGDVDDALGKEFWE